MATFNERIQVVIDVVTDKATKGFKDFRTAVGEAEGFTGKLKAGVSSLGGIFGAATSGPLAMGAAVAAAGKFAADAVTDYANLGVQVADFAAATGLATEDASRWVEVSGDLGISAEALQLMLGKLNKTIDPKLFDELGVSIARTSSGAVDVNATFLNVIDRLRAIKDPAEQARVGAELLGRGWQSVAPLISRSAKDIKDQLDGVSSSKVFSKEDTDKAQRFDKAMKDLSDAAQELAIRLGKELIPVLTDTLGPVADLAGGLGDLKDQMGVFGASGLEANNSLRDLIASLFESTDTTTYTGEAITNLGDSAAGSARYLGLLAEHTRESSDAAADLTGNARLAKAQLKLLQDQIDGRKSFIDLQQQLRDDATKIKDLETAFKDSKKTAQDAEDFYLGVASATLDAQGALTDYLSKIDEIPDTIKTEIVAAFDPLNPQKTWNDIQSYFDTHAIQVRTETSRENRSPLNGTPTTDTTGATGKLKGVPGQAESVGGFGRNSGGVTVVVNAPVGANLAEAGRQVADALRAYYANGGEPV